VNWFVKNQTANFDQTSPIEGDPEYSGQKKPNGPFHLTSDQNYRNLWYSGKHPQSFCVGALQHGK